MTGYGLYQFTGERMRSDDAAVFFEEFWENFDGFQQLRLSSPYDPNNYSLYREWMQEKAMAKQSLSKSNRYRNVILTPPSHIPLTIYKSPVVVPSERRRAVDERRQRNLNECLLLKKLHVSQLIEIFKYLGPVSQLIARQVSKDFFDAFNEHCTRHLHKADEQNNAAVLRRDAREHGFRQRIANYQHKYNNTIFHGRSNSPVCVIPTSPGAKWMNHIDIMFLDTPYISNMDYEIGRLYKRLVVGSKGRRFQITLKPQANPTDWNADDIAETDESAIKDGYCLGCRRMRFTDRASRTLQLYGFVTRLLFRMPVPVVMGNSLPHTSCLVFEKCQTNCCQCCSKHTSDIDKFENPMEKIDDFYSPEGNGPGHVGKAVLNLEERPHEAYCCEQVYGRQPNTVRQAAATRKYGGFYDFGGVPMCGIERAHPDIGSERHPTQNSDLLSHDHNLLWGILCGTCKTHHSRLLFDDENHPNKIELAGSVFGLQATAEDMMRKCLLSEQCMNKYLGGPKGGRTHSFNVPIFRLKPGKRLRYRTVSKKLRNVLGSNVCTVPNSPFNRFICAHMRSGGSSLFDKLMLPFEPGVCACFDFDEAPPGSVPVSGHGEQNHTHKSRNKGSTDFRRNTNLRNLVEECTIRHAAPRHIHKFFSPLAQLYDSDNNNDGNESMEPIAEDKCCRCLAVGDPSRQGVFTIGEYDKEDLLCGTVEPIMYPHQYRCMHCVTHYSWVRDRDDPQLVVLRIERFLDSTETNERGIWGALASMDPVRVFQPRKGSTRSSDLKYVTWCDHSGDGRLDGTPRSNNFQEQCSTTANWYKHTERIATCGINNVRNLDVMISESQDQDSAYRRFAASLDEEKKREIDRRKGGQRMVNKPWRVLDHIG